MTGFHLVLWSYIAALLAIAWGQLQRGQTGWLLSIAWVFALLITSYRVEESEGAWRNPSIVAGLAFQFSALQAIYQRSFQPQGLLALLSLAAAGLLAGFRP